MTFSVKRFMAIFQKDLKDLYRNLYVSSTIILPLVFALIYGRMDVVPLEIHIFIISISLSMVGAFLQCAIIAEEKEKNTLRGLMLSPATITEILAGKSAVTIVITLVITYISMLISGFSPSNLIPVIVGVVLSLVFFIALGTWLGLITRSVLEASIYILPVMFIFGMSNMFIGFAEEYPFLKVLEYTPAIQLFEIANITNGTIADYWQPFAIIGAWIVVGAGLTILSFKKRMMD